MSSHRNYFINSSFGFIFWLVLCVKLLAQMRPNRNRKGWAGVAVIYGSIFYSSSCMKLMTWNINAYIMSPAVDDYISAGVPEPKLYSRKTFELTLFGRLPTLEPKAACPQTSLEISWLNLSFVYNLDIRNTTCRWGCNNSWAHSDYLLAVHI